MAERLGLIPDRPAPYGDDLLGHEEIAEELAGIALTVGLPANIALYGRWGAGKSSVANALEEIIQRNEKASWVRYDAFKWSGEAFHRHFLIQVSDQLDAAIDPDDVYGEKSSTVLDFSLKDVGRTLATSVVFVALMAGLLAAMFLVGHLITEQLESDIVRRLAGAVLAPVTLLAAGALIVKTLLAASIDTLKVSRTVSAPSSGEQFEREFETLISPMVENGRRVVVFIDELDRCAPADVVETLDAIRTFLDVPGCVCIVAADKQALETALSVAVAQQTPRDTTNPYYSTGGAYLDKVFAYQVSLPPPLNRRLTSLASELVRSSGGVWEEVEDRDRIVSVLVPTHVASPRRVKALLNAYAVAYMLMKRKVAAGVVEGPTAAREVELAKLVCLQIEFPLFARELANDHLLPATMLELAEERTTNTRLRREQTAWRFLDADLDVGVDISRSHDGVIREQAQTGSPTLVDDGGPDRAEAESEDHEGPATDEVRLVDQLVAYLRKTRHVEDPRPDLIHLEAMGATHGLDPKLARELQDLAVDLSDQLVARVKELAENERANAVLMLADSLRDAVGLDTDNFLSSILRLLGLWRAGTLGPIADRITDHVASELHRVEIAGEDRAGALVLGIASTRPSRKRLLDEAFSDPDALAEAPLGTLVVAHLDALAGTMYEKPAAHALAARLTDPDTAEQAAQSLVSLPVENSTRIALFAAADIADQLAGQDDEGDDEGNDGGEEKKAERDRRIATYGEMISALDAHEPTLRALVLPLLRLDIEAARNAIEPLLPRLGNSDDQDFTDQLLSAALPRLRQAAWIEAVDWAAGLNLDSHVRKLVQRLWARSIQPKIDRAANAETREALAKAARQAGIDLTGPDDVPAELAEAEVPSEEDDAKAIVQRLNAAQEFIGAGLLGSEATAAALRPTVLGWIRTAPATNIPQQPVVVRERLRAQSPYMQRAVAFVADSPDATTEIVAALNDDCYADDDVRIRLLVHALAGSPGREVVDEVTPERVAEVLQAHGPRAHELVADWISLGLPTAAQIRSAVDSQGLLRGDRVGSIADALRRWSSESEADEVAAFAGWVAADCSLSEWVYHVCDPSAADPEILATLLVAAWGSTSNNADRRRVLDVWSWAKDILLAQRKTLVEDIFLGYLDTASTNQQAASWVTMFAPLVAQPPYGTLTRLREALKPFVSAENGARVREAYENAGIIEPGKRKKRGPFEGLLHR